MEYNEIFLGFQVKHLMIVGSTITTFGAFISSGNLQTILSGGCGKNGATIAVDTSLSLSLYCTYIVHILV